MINIKRYLSYVVLSIISGFAIAILIRLFNPEFLPQLNTFLLGVLVFALPMDLILFTIQVASMVRLGLPPFAFLSNDYYAEMLNWQKKSLEWETIVQKLTQEFKISKVRITDDGYSVSLKPNSNNLFGGTLLFTFNSNDECQIAYRSGRIFDLGKDVVTVRKCREILETME